MTMPHRNIITAVASIWLLASLASTAKAQSLSPPAELDALFACQSETDDGARLVCFDQAASALRTANASGDLVAISRDDVDNVERDAFGFNLPSLPRLRGILGLGKSNAEASGDAASADGESSNPTKADEPLDRVMLEVDRWERSNSGRYRFYLTNGQVWMQAESDSIRRPKKDENGVLRVEIRKASFGSFLLKVNGKGRSVRVRRIE